MRLLLSVLFGHRLYKIVSRLDQEQLIEDEGGYPFVGVGHGSSSSHARVAISARKVSPLVAPQAGNGLQSDTMPLPTRKPERPTVKKALSSRTVLKRTIQRQVVQKPKSIQFGSFGYPYTGSAE